MPFGKLEELILPKLDLSPREFFELSEPGIRTTEDAESARARERCICALWAALMHADSVRCESSVDDWSYLWAEYERNGETARLKMTSKTWKKARLAGYSFTDVLVRSVHAFPLIIDMAFSCAIAEASISGIWRPGRQGRQGPHPDGRGFDLTSVVYEMDNRSPARVRVPFFRNPRTMAPKDAPEMEKKVVEWGMFQAGREVSQVLTPWTLVGVEGYGAIAKNLLRRATPLQEKIEYDHHHHLHVTIRNWQRTRRLLRERLGKALELP